MVGGVGEWRGEQGGVVERQRLGEVERDLGRFVAPQETVAHLAAVPDLLHREPGRLQRFQVTPGRALADLQQAAEFLHGLAAVGDRKFLQQSPLSDQLTRGHLRPPPLPGGCPTTAGCL